MLVRVGRKVQWPAVLFSLANCGSHDLKHTACSASETPVQTKGCPFSCFFSKVLCLLDKQAEFFCNEGQHTVFYLLCCILKGSNHTMAHSSYGNCSDGIKPVGNTIGQNQSQQVYVIQWETWHWAQIFVEAGTARSLNRAWERTLTEKSLCNSWAVNAM